MLIDRNKCSARVASRSVTAFAVVVSLIALLAGRIDAMGLIPYGGSPTIGITANEITSDISRPSTPLSSLLLDEIFPSLLPPYNAIIPAAIEEHRSNRARLTLTSDVVWSDNPARILTSYDIVQCWTARASERWDARWALRCISGIETPDSVIEGLSATDNRTLEINIREGMNFSQLQDSLRSFALRLDLASAAGGSIGAGPFLMEQTSPDRRHLTSSLAFFGGRAYINEANIIAYPSADDSVLDFGRGNLNALLITSNERDRYAESSRAATGRMERVGQAVIVLILNPATLPDTDQRRALALAIDRDSLARVVLGEGAVVVDDFNGTQPENTTAINTIDEARRLYSSLANPIESVRLLVCDDPASRAASGRIRANWESLGIPVEIDHESGSLMLSQYSDAILISVRLPNNSGGVLPECLALYDRSGWWDIIGLGMSGNGIAMLRSVRNLQPDADLNAAGTALQESALAIPLARYDILFAPGPDISLAPSSVFPGTTFWRAYLATASSR